MTYSIRIGFLLALLSVFLWAGIYHPKVRHVHKKLNTANILYPSVVHPSGVIFVPSKKHDLSGAFENLKFKDFRLILRDFMLNNNPELLIPKKTEIIAAKAIGPVPQSVSQKNTQPESQLLPQAKPLSVELPDVQRPDESNNATPTEIQSAALLGDIGHTQFVLRLSQRPLYSVHVSDNLQVITLTLDNINPDLSKLPPLDTQDTAISNIVFSDSATNQLIISITLQPKVDVQSLRYKANNLILDVGMSAQLPYTQITQDSQKNNAQNALKDAEENEDPHPVVKKLVPSTPEALAKENYNEALDLLKTGNTQGAKELLQMVVAQHPNYTQPRILLANIYMQESDARQALVILQGVYPQPNIQEEAGYYNLLAEAYRQSGQPKTAVNIYRQLLTMNTSDGTWWVGLGMCFEALDQNAAALEAYQKAKLTQDLPPVLLDFVSEKLDVNK